MDKLADIPWQVVVPGGREGHAQARVAFHPPINQGGLPQKLADHPHPVVGVLQAAGPAGDGQVDGEHDDEHQQADQEEQPVLTTELDTWGMFWLQMKKLLHLFTHFLSRLDR